MEQYLIAHDLGTSGDKATLFTVDGRLYKSVIIPYSSQYAQGNQVEQNPEEWYDAVCRATRELVTGIDLAGVLGIGFSGHMMGAVLLDKHGDVLRPAIIWADQRAVAERELIGTAIGEDRFYQITGTRNNPTASIAKLMWVQRNENHRVGKMINCKDYISYRLTGNIGTDYSDASGTGAFDIHTFKWSEEILDIVGVSRHIMPELQESTALAGRVTQKAALECGLLEGTPVFRGCGDGTAATVGAGVTKKGECYCCLGSSAWVACIDDKPLLDEKKRTFNMAGIKKGSVFPIGVMQAAGLSYNWMKDELCQHEKEEARSNHDNVYECINRQIAEVPAGARGVLYLPYLIGERSPWWDDSARGAFLGLCKSTTHADMLRAVMEGVTLNLALNFSALRQYHDFKSIRIMGGCAKETVWRQIVADIFGLPVMTLNYLEEACSMGAAVVAGIGAGIYKDGSAIEKFVQVNDVVEPILENTRIYKEILVRFEDAYKRLKGLY